jgi:hypothetical protein
MSNNLPDPFGEAGEALGLLLLAALLFAAAGAVLWLIVNAHL